MHESISLTIIALLLRVQSFVTRAAHTPAPSLDNGALLRERTATDDGAGSSAGVSDGAPSPAAATAAPQQSSSLIGDLLDLDISDPPPAPAAAAPPPPSVDGSIPPAAVSFFVFYFFLLCVPQPQASWPPDDCLTSYLDFEALPCEPATC